jgi:CheY-like chemotaxis protein
MPRVLVIHWNRSEADERAERLRARGFRCEAFCEPREGAALRAIRGNPPDAIIIDLARLPSHGRAAGVFLRGQKSTRHVPLVFIEGDAEKTARTRELLPDAVYTTWPRAVAALRGALRNAPAAPVVPGTFDGYSGTPLATKLRIRPGSTVLIDGAPEGFEAGLEPLPEGASACRRSADPDVILAFVRSQAELSLRMPELARGMRQGRTLWIVWPKKTSALAGDLGEPAVRATGLATGLVDYKVCAVDSTWSGLAFALRRDRRAGVR